MISYPHELTILRLFRVLLDWILCRADVYGWRRNTVTGWNASIKISTPAINARRPSRVAETVRPNNWMRPISSKYRPRQRLDSDMETPLLI